MTQGLTTTSWQPPYMARTPRRPTSTVRQCCGIRSCGVTRLLQSWASGLTSTITSQVRAQWQSQPHCTSLCPGNLLPDYCNGNLYAVTPKVGLLLAEGAKHVFHHYHAEDLYLNGKLEYNLLFIRLWVQDWLLRGYQRSPTGACLLSLATQSGMESWPTVLCSLLSSICSTRWCWEEERPME